MTLARTRTYTALSYTKQEVEAWRLPVREGKATRLRDPDGRLGVVHQVEAVGVVHGAPGGRVRVRRARHPAGIWVFDAAAGTEVKVSTQLRSAPLRWSRWGGFREREQRPGPRAAPKAGGPGRGLRGAACGLWPAACCARVHRSLPTTTVRPGPASWELGLASSSSSACRAVTLRCTPATATARARLVLRLSWVPRTDGRTATRRAAGAVRVHA